MARYIDAKLAIKVANRYSLARGSNYGRHSGIADAIVDEIEQLPVADVEPVHHGQWVWDKDHYYCSCCGNNRFTNNLMLGFDAQYCSYCGAKMSASAIDVKELYKNNT